MKNQSGHAILFVRRCQAARKYIFFLSPAHRRGNSPANKGCKDLSLLHLAQLSGILKKNDSPV